MTNDEFDVLDELYFLQSYEYLANTLDLSAIPVLRELTHLPIMVDPSHAIGERDKIPPMALASKIVGAHGIMVEFHPEPEKALSDGPQALRYPQFAQLMKDLKKM